MLDFPTATRRCFGTTLHVGVGALAFLGLSFLTPRVRAGTDEACPAFPWQHLGDTATELSRPLPLVLVGGAVIAPITFAPTGLDHELRLVAQEDLGGSYRFESASIYAPYVLAGGVFVGYGVSLAAGACDWERPQAAMLQAMALTFGTVALFKWSVGREWPNGGQDPAEPNRLDHPERARDFAPFQRYGSWPSGHTAILFAAASSFRTSVPELGIFAWLGYPFALAVAAGMWIGDHHWMSDILSGGLLGEAIGSSVGYGFARSPAKSTVGFGVAPVPGDGALVQAYGVW
jgi:membrane-associated phospholipid phosphatase